MSAHCYGLAIYTNTTFFFLLFQSAYRIFEFKGLLCLLHVSLFMHHADRYLSNAITHTVLVYFHKKLSKCSRDVRKPIAVPVQ